MSVQHCSIGEAHYLWGQCRVSENECVLQFTAGRAGVQQRTAVAQSMGLPSCFIFSIRAFSCSFFLSLRLSMIRNLWAVGWTARYLALKTLHSQRKFHQFHIAVHTIPARSDVVAAILHLYSFPLSLFQKFLFTYCSNSWSLSLKNSSEGT